MPHKCIRCLQTFADNAHEILQGCTCGSKAFFYTRDTTVVVIPSSPADSTEVSDFSESAVIQNSEDGDDDAFTVDLQALLDKKTIHSTEDGKYSINLDAVFAGQRPKL